MVLNRFKKIIGRSKEEAPASKTHGEIKQYLSSLQEPDRQKLYQALRAADKEETIKDIESLDFSSYTSYRPKPETMRDIDQWLTKGMIEQKHSTNETSKRVW